MHCAVAGDRAYTSQIHYKRRQCPRRGGLLCVLMTPLACCRSCDDKLAPASLLHQREQVSRDPDVCHYLTPRRHQHHQHHGTSASRRSRQVSGWAECSGVHRHEVPGMEQNLRRALTTVM